MMKGQTAICGARHDEVLAAVILQWKIVDAECMVVSRIIESKAVEKNKNATGNKQG